MAFRGVDRERLYTNSMQNVIGFLLPLCTFMECELRAESRPTSEKTRRHRAAANRCNLSSTRLRVMGSRLLRQNNKTLQLSAALQFGREQLSSQIARQSYLVARFRRGVWLAQELRKVIRVLRKVHGGGKAWREILARGRALLRGLRELFAPARAKAQLPNCKE